jgi:hypothetical protein
VLRSWGFELAAIHSLNVMKNYFGLLYGQAILAARPFLVWDQSLNDGSSYSTWPLAYKELLKRQAVFRKQGGDAKEFPAKIFCLLGTEWVAVNYSC